MAKQIGKARPGTVVNDPTLEALRDKAQKEKDAGHTKSALELMKDYASRCEKAYGESDERTLEATANVVRLLRALDLKSEMLSTQQHALAVCKKAFGEDDQRTLEAMREVAVSLRATGLEEEATKLILHGFSIRENYIRARAKEIEHMDMDMLKRVFDMADDISFQSTMYLPEEQSEAASRKALAIKRDVLAMFAKVLSMEDEKTFDALDDMAWSYVCNSCWDDVIAMREEILKTRRKVCGNEDARTIESMEKLAADIEAWMNAPEKSRPIREKLLTIRKKQVKEYKQAYGPSDSKTLAAMEKVIEQLEALGRNEQVLKTRKEILAMCQKAYGENSEETLSALQNLAWDFAAMHRNAEARQIRQSLLALYQKRRDKAMENGDEEAAIDAMESMGYQLNDLRRPAQEEKIRCEILTLNKQRFGTEHEDTAFAVERLANLLHERGKYTDELPLREQLVAWNQKSTARMRTQPFMPC